MGADPGPCPEADGAAGAEARQASAGCAALRPQ